MNDSGYTSYNLGDSHAADSTDFGSAGNPQEKADSSSASMCVEEKKENVRNGRNAYVYHVSLPDYKYMLSLDCESTGQETILNMVKNRLRDVKRKFKFENMLFMNEKKDYLNVGLPVGVLSTEKTYECEFKDLVLKPGDHFRQYSVEEYSSNWEIGHFFVSKVPYPVGKFSKSIHGRMQVDFFQDESIFEALARDKRFDEEKLRYCTVICDQNQSNLSFGARHYQGKSIEIQRTLKQKDNKLPDTIQPRPHPDASKVKVEPSKIKQEMDSATVGPSTVQPLASSTPEPTTSLKSQISEDNFSHLIECAFEVISSQKLTTKEKKKLAKQCDLKFTNFALKQGLSVYICQLKNLIEITKSVGAVFKINTAKFPELVGTCFRIGMQYIITNNHVMNLIEPPVSSFIDFNFEEGEAPKGRRYEPDSMLLRSDVLDFAILKLKEPPDELPPCIFTHGISIMDPDNSTWSMLEGQCLTLIGHPQSQPKQTDLMCPVETTSQVGRQVYGYSLQRDGHLKAKKNEFEFHDQRRGKYQVFNFFEGSSGSPGIIFLNGKRHLVILHTKGFYLDDPKRTSIEQGILFTEIFKHVRECIKKGENVLRDVMLVDIFPSVERAEPMDID